MLERNPFQYKDSEYKRSITIFRDYIESGALYLHKMTGDPIEKCREYVASNIKKDGLFPIQDPRVLTIDLDENGDRDKHITTLGEYINTALQKDELISPVWNTYLQPSVSESYQSKFTRGNIAARKVIKKDKFKYEMVADRAKLEGNLTRFEEYKTKAEIADIGQNNKKVTNNSLSGTYTVRNTPLHNPTYHSVLTSTCRCTSGYGNANNEKLLAGNRHYWNKSIVVNNILSIITHYDKEKTKAVMDKYQLHYPTPEEALQVIRRGAMLYWLDEYKYQELLTFLKTLTPLDLAAFCYIGDLYHIRQYNDLFIRNLIKKLTVRVEDNTITEAKKQWFSIDPDFTSIALSVFEKEVAGTDIGSDVIKDEDDLMKNLAATAKNVESTIAEYGDFISVFFTTTNVPASLARFPSSVRKVVLASDTDSTIFTTQEWVEWYCGIENHHTQEATNVSAVMNTFASQTIIHLLALMSANFGVKEKDLHVISMKNEFKFRVFAVTNVSKHYNALITVQEGNVYANPKVEIKGVHMKNSNAPAKINADSHAMMLDVMKNIDKNEPVSLIYNLKEVADSERRVIDAYRRGSPEFCRFTKIKELATYRKGAMASPFQYHIFWNEVFGPKYGMMPEPPYLMVKVKTSELNSLNKIMAWTDTMEDRQLAKRVIDYCAKHNKKQLATLYVPMDIANSHGLPVEITNAANLRGVVKDIHKTYYIILETLGLYFEDTHANRLVSDYY